MRTVAKRLQEDRLKVSYDEGARKPGDIILAMVGARLALSRVPVLSQVGEHRLADAQPHCDNWSPLVANQQILG
jgi:hypothetical protein